MNKFDQESEAYPVLLKFDVNVRSVLWITGGASRDHFFSHSNGQLVIADSVEQLKEFVAKNSEIKVHWDEFSEYDLNIFWRKVRDLRSHRGSTQKTCNIILDVWNLLEDFAFSLNTSPDLTIFKSERIKVIYQKLFHGCNLPSVTPDKHQYMPVWLPVELVEFKPALKELWQQIVTSTSNFENTIIRT